VESSVIPYESDNGIRVAARQSALATGLLLFVIYLATGAPSLTFWDASEFATAIATFGVPHPPGTPLYVATGSALWHLIPVLTPVQAGTLLSALATAGACALAASIITSVSGRRLTGVVAGLCAGVMGTVWMNATETEVYAVSLLSVAAQFAAAWHAHRTDDDRARVLLAYFAALSVPVHLSALVATPAALLLANTDRDGRVRWPSVGGGMLLVGATIALSRAQVWLAAALVAAAIAGSWLRGPTASTARLTWLRRAGLVTALAWSAATIMLVRAGLSPLLNQGDPDTLARLLDVMSRAQYDVAGFWPRRAPLWLQLGNIVQYADWQVALSLWNDVTPSLWRTPFSVVALLVGAVGAVAHWRTHRSTARALSALMLLATLGVCAQLNLRAGPSFGIGVLPATAIHEARERDYFYALAFWGWGLWIGVGAVALAHRVRAVRVQGVRVLEPSRGQSPSLQDGSLEGISLQGVRVLDRSRGQSRVGRTPWLAAIVPALMVAGSWSAVTRAAWPDRRLTTAIAGELLEHVPIDGLLLTAGDNDTYPLWYRQAVDHTRADVQVVVMSLLPADWYLREGARLTGPFAPDTSLAADALTRAAWLVRRKLEVGGAVAVSILVHADTRTALGRMAGITCWRRAGLVDIGSTSPGECLPRVDVDRSLASARRLHPYLVAVPRQSPDGMVAAFLDVARCPGAAALATRAAAARDSATRELLDITCNFR